MVLVSKFVTGKSQKFTNYVNYMNRNEATRTKKFESFNINQLDGYNHYMGNPEKSTGIFTAKKSNLSQEERDNLKELFNKAQENDSVMWQDVISFNNKWLAKHGLYRPGTGWINEGAIQDSIRSAMKVVMSEEGLEASGIWSASIHLNTDHIHVHIATVEPEPTRKYQTFKDKESGEEYTARRGYRHKKTLDLFKSKVANSLVNRDQSLQQISELIHERMGNKQVRFRPMLNEKMRGLFETIYNDLPEDMRLWKYNMNALNETRPLIDGLIGDYLNTYCSADMKRFDDLLLKGMNFRKEVYGEGDKESERYKDVRTNKYHELYSKLGNALLKEMRNIRKSERNHQSEYPSGSTLFHESNHPKIKLSRWDINQMKRALDSAYQSFKNQRRYEEMQREIEQQQRQN